MRDKTMPNSKTEHSKQLRAGTASAARLAALKSGKKKKIEMMGDAELVDTVKANLQSIPGATALLKIRFLIDFYKDNQ